MSGFSFEQFNSAFTMFGNINYDKWKKASDTLTLITEQLAKEVQNQLISTILEYNGKINISSDAQWGNRRNSKYIWYHIEVVDLNKSLMFLIGSKAINSQNGLYLSVLTYLTKI